MMIICENSEEKVGRYAKIWPPSRSCVIGHNEFRSDDLTCSRAPSEMTMPCYTVSPRCSTVVRRTATPPSENGYLSGKPMGIVAWLSASLIRRRIQHPVEDCATLRPSNFQVKDDSGFDPPFSFGCHLDGEIVRRRWRRWAWECNQVLFTY